MAETPFPWRSAESRRLSVPLAGACRAVLRAAAGCYNRWLQRRNLAELDDHLLRDIGLTPEDRRRETAKPFWR